MVMANALKPKTDRAVHRKRAANNAKCCAPSGSEYPLGGFGSGKVTNQGRKPDGYVPKGHRP